MRWVILLLCCLLAMPSWAGRPFATEDAGVLESGECELEAFAGRERLRVAPGITTLFGQVGCGIGRRTQLALGAGRASEAGDHTLERPAALGSLDLMGEVFGTDRERAVLQLGVRWPLRGERLFLDASVGRQMSGGGARLARLGLKHAF